MAAVGLGQRFFAPTADCNDQRAVAGVTEGGGHLTACSEPEPEADGPVTIVDQ
jgi:hypothetical protein